MHVVDFSTLRHVGTGLPAAQTAANISVIPCRDFLQRILPSFKEHNPQLDIAAQVKRGQHPHLTAEYGEMFSWHFIVGEKRHVSCQFVVKPTNYRL